MSKSRLLVSLVTVALIVGCVSGGSSNRIMRAKTSGVVIVHKDATADQETVEIQARNGMSGTTGVPSTIVWTEEDSNATLSIEFADRDQKCVRGLHCSGNNCTAFSNVDFRESAPAQCRYKTSLNNGAVTHDPIVIIDNCCP